MQNISCALCGHNQTSLVFLGKDPDWSTGDEFNVVKCKKCGLVYVNPRPDKEEIKKYYPSENWSRARSRINVEDAVISGAHWSIAVTERVEPILKFKKKGKILDIGCGDGLLLYYLKHLGWDCYGIEPGEVAAKYAREVLNLKVSNATLENIKYTDEFFDIVNLQHVFEHLDNPLESLKKINQMLKPGGYLVVGVPNFDSFDRRLFGKRWVGLKLPQHLFQYTEKTLKIMMKKSGFKVCNATYKSYEAKSTMYYSESLRYLLRDFGLYPAREENANKSVKGPTNDKEFILKTLFHIIERGIFKSIGFICDKLNYGSNITVVAKKQ